MTAPLRGTTTVLLMTFTCIAVVCTGYACQQLSPNSIEFKDRGNAAAPTVVPLAIDTKTVIHTTSEKFLSLALDVGIMRRKWETFDISSPRVQTLARGLQPAILRFGGNSADYLFFNRSAHCPYMAGQPVSTEQIEQWENSYVRHQKYDNFTMSATDFDYLNKFAAIAQWLLLFDFNVLLRNGSDWDQRNAIEILEYSIERNYSHNLAFQLGNEPNDFKHRFSWPFKGDQLGRDVLMLQKTLKHNPRFSQFFANSIQVGPDVTRPPRSLKFLKKYLSVVHDSLDAVTWHQYYINGRTATVSDFIDPDILDYLPSQIAEVKTAVREAGVPQAELWLGETSTAWGGGAKGLSDAYVAGFMWLDKLGISAKMGISLVVRQTFYGGHYSLIDRYLQPLPDYWLSLLFKRLVGSRVLNVTMLEKDSQTLRVYSHCTATGRSNYSVGAITVYALNLRNSAVSLGLPSELRHLIKHQYLLTPSGPDGLKSRYVSLNGQRLELIDDWTLPLLAPKQLTADHAPTLPPLTFGFFVIPHAKASACL